MSPGPTSVATYNHALGQKAYAAQIDDAAIRIKAERVPFSGITKGLRSVAIVVAGIWTIAVPDTEGRFSAQVDLSNATVGPLVVDVYGWDARPTRTPTRSP